jgi:hypothetical protein
MKLKALLTMLVLGTSSIAVASPTPAPIVRDHRTQPAPVFQPTPVHLPPVYQPRPMPPVQRPSWVTLGGVHQITDGAMTFRVGRLARGFSTLKLQSAAGKSLIQRVLIQFMNGRTQTVELGRYLNASNPTITIDLAGGTRSIAKVTVIGRNARQSAFRVLAI